MKTERERRIGKIPKNAFKKWLRRKGLTVQDFSTKSGVYVHTVEKWAYIGSMPREALAEKVKVTFPDCPLSALA